MPDSDIQIKGAREHNLRDVDLLLPRNQLVCLTGVSGSGKSSLAFDTLYAEGQRRYVESLSSFARHLLGQMPKPDVDLISGLSPSISISQKSSGTNPRSTVGTITEIYDYLRVLYARVGQGHCPRCHRPVTAQTREEILAGILRLEAGQKFMLLAPLIRGQKGHYRDLFEDLLKQGFVRARVDGQIVSLSDDLQLDRQMRHHIEVVVDRLTTGPAIRPRLAESVETALTLGDGNLIVMLPDQQQDLIFSSDFACSHCQISFQPPSPQLFSFNSPQGMCLGCDGLGKQYTFDQDLLIPDESLSFKKGCFETLGTWKQLGRWRRHLYQGVADTIERLHDLPAGTMLETAWEELSESCQNYWLWGTGSEHITFTWRGGSSPIKYGGTFEGIIPDLLNKYRSSNSRPQRRSLERYMRTLDCPDCQGARLNPQARHILIESTHSQFESGFSLPQICGLCISDAADFFSDLELSDTQRVIATEALKEIRSRLGFLLNVGLDYLTLDRTAPTLSGGESQRIRLASQIGSGLVGVLYILDEPSIGLHPRDNHRLLQTLHHLRDMGNTVVVVEHDEDTMRAADHVIDFGPGAGVRGGEVVASGSLNDVLQSSRSVTAQYLKGERTIPVRSEPRAGNGQELRILGARHNNLDDVQATIPLGKFVCVTGVSGSGKSSLVNDILSEALRRDLNRGEGEPGVYDEITGLEHLDKLIAIDQSPIGRTPRSNPGTYIKVFDDIRNLFAQMPESKRRGYKPGRFSFNVAGGRCEACEGNGANRLEMDFLADIWVKCPVCEGHRYNRETRQVEFKGKSIADVLEMDVQQLLELFDNIPKVKHKLQTLHDVGLDYLKLGQPSPTLSGGEAQRIKLARELVKKSTGKTLYLLDEPTTGLHFADIHLLLDVLHGFVDAGNTVLVVEHNLDVIKTADWLIDLGPEGGAGGGRIVASGTPDQVAQHAESHTGAALRAEQDRIRSDKQTAAPKPERNGRKKTQQPLKTIQVRGATQHNLKHVDATIQRDQMTVFCGPSGSGKTSLAMDTIYAEGQRRYVESLSSYARQFVGQMQKPQLDHIEGLSPAIAIEQKNLGQTPRSTVGTVTEIYDYLRILMARLGTPHCPDCDQPVGTQTSDQIIDSVMQFPTETRLYLMAPVQVDVGQQYDLLWEDLRTAGFARIRVDGQTYPLSDPPKINRRRQHEVSVVLDRIVVRKANRSRIADSVEMALTLGKGVMQAALVDKDTDESRWEVRTYSQHLACHQCGRSFDPLTPHNFSFNSPLGWCESCEGLGVQSGANPTALIRDEKKSLAEGALLLWPQLDHVISQFMLEALSAGTGLPLDVPFEQLSARHRRLLFQGTGDQWFTVYGHGNAKTKAKALFQFQFKGLHPALEEASRQSYSLRTRLESLVDEVACTVCSGSRLRDDASAARFRNKTIDDLCRLPLSEFQRTVDQWKLKASEKRIAGELVREIKDRTRFLSDVGLGYLTLARGAATLSNGEAQRIRLASQLGSGLCGVLYVLDEPTIGLHPRDSGRLVRALHRLRDLGNTLILVEHDRDVIAAADQVHDFGPAAGKHGGQVVAHGTVAQIQNRRKSVTGPFLSGEKSLPLPAKRRITVPARAKAFSADDRPEEKLEAPGGGWLKVCGARHHNLQDLDVALPLGTLAAVTGPSGSGKSSLIDEVLYPFLARKLHRSALTPGSHDEVLGVEHINKVIRVDQQPLGNSPSSNPATYTGLFDPIRQLFAQLPESKLRGYTARRFSFNVPGGRCEACEGNGQICIEMHFLPDVWVECETCRGQRYNPETLAVTFHGRTINDVLNMTCGEAVELFQNIPKIRRILQTLCDVGLDYVTLGQPAPTLSGGEAQRVKLAAELARPDTGRTLYLLDEPTTGLHFNDLERLLEVLQRLVDLGNTVVLIEHNLDIIKSADWIIDIGPEAGAEGGHLVACGTPEQVAQYANRRPRPAKRSWTGEALAPLLKGPRVERKVFDPAENLAELASDKSIEQIGAATKMPWEKDGQRWHTSERLDRKGAPVRWEGRILEETIDRIQKMGDFADTNWNSRSVVEITGKVKSRGWFLHAITAETWLLKMKFRVRRGTFQRDQLQSQIPLPTLNEMDELPVYSNDPRVRCKNAQGPWQEVEIRAHSFAEIDTPGYWTFLEQAVAGFSSHVESKRFDAEEHTPWKKMGKKWHYMRKGFTPGRRVEWEPAVLEKVFDLLTDAHPDGEFQWNNKQLVHLFVKGSREPWASVRTKKCESLDVTLHVPKDAVTHGQISELGCDGELDASDPERDLVSLRFKQPADVRKGHLVKFLALHLKAVLRQNDL